MRMVPVVTAILDSILERAMYSKPDSVDSVLLVADSSIGDIEQIPIPVRILQSAIETYSRPALDRPRFPNSPTQ